MFPNFGSQRQRKADTNSWVGVFVFSALIFFAISQTADRAYCIDFVDGHLQVENVTDAFPPTKKSGILIWSDTLGNHRWQAARDPVILELKPSVDSRGVPVFDPSNYLGFSRSAPVLEQAQLRGLNLLTPPPGDALFFGANPKFRRLPDNGKYPALKVRLDQLGPENQGKIQRKLSWAEGAAELDPGQLPPGDYVLKDDNLLSARFRILPLANPELKRTGEMLQLGNQIPGTVELVAIQELTGLGNGIGLWSALDLFDQLKQKGPTGKGLDSLRSSIFNSLLSRQPNASPAQGAEGISAMANPTGIGGIDAARFYIQSGRFGEAEKSLKPLLSHADKRTRGLAWLYWGALRAEGGEADREAAEACLDKSFVDLNGTPDLYRLKSAQGQYQARRAVEGFNDAMPRLVSNLQSSLTNSIQLWLSAWDEFGSLGKDSTGDVNTSLDKVQLLSAMASLVDSLQVPSESQRIIQGIKSQVEKIGNEADPAKAASVYQPILLLLARAELNLREKPEEAKSLAMKAGQASVSEGFVSGLENACRILGQVWEKDHGSHKKDVKKARVFYEQSRVITRLLADQAPKERLGRWVSGFLSQRAFVLVALVELCIDSGDNRSALAYAEELKTEAYARTLFALNRSWNPGERDLEKIFSSWPAELSGLEYFVGRSACWAFLVSKSAGEGAKVRIYTLRDENGGKLVPAKLLQQSMIVQQELNQWKKKNVNRLLNGRPASGLWQDVLHSLGRSLMPEEILVELRKSEYCLVVPHHVLHYVPFAALVLEPQSPPLPKGQLIAHPKRLLLDEPFCCFQAPSFTTWNLRRKIGKSTSELEARVVGLVEVPGQVALPNIQVDLDNFKARFKKGLKAVLADPGPDPTNFLKIMGSPGVLMVSTHGMNDAENPMSSHLYLMPDEKHPDGHLTAADIVSRPSRFDLVVLSACYSGLGSKSPPPGDDLLGLQRVFLETGSRAVLAGLWDIDDKTAPVLVDRFYKEALDGKPLAKAWKNSQKAFLDRARKDQKAILDQHPYFWGVSCLIGDGLMRINP